LSVSEDAFSKSLEPFLPESLGLCSAVPFEYLLGEEESYLCEFIPHFTPLTFALSCCNRSITSSFLEIVSLRNATCKIDFEYNKTNGHKIFNAKYKNLKTGRFY
jgi:hypothetical protein